MPGRDFLKGGVSGGYLVKGRWPDRRCSLHSKENKALEVLDFPFSTFFLQQEILTLCWPQQSPVNHCQAVWNSSSVWVQRFYNLKCYSVCESTIQCLKEVERCHMNLLKHLVSETFGSTGVLCTFHDAIDKIGSSCIKKQHQF